MFWGYKFIRVYLLVKFYITDQPGSFDQMDHFLLETPCAELAVACFPKVSKDVFWAGTPSLFIRMSMGRIDILWLLSKLNYPNLT